MPMSNLMYKLQMDWFEWWANIRECGYCFQEYEDPDDENEGMCNACIEKEWQEELDHMYRAAVS